MQTEITSDHCEDLASKAQREVLEVLLGHPDCFQQVSGRVSVVDFGPDECIQELAQALYKMLSQDTSLQLSQLYGRIESSRTAGLLTELQRMAEQKNNLSQLEGALATRENQKQNHRVQTLKQELSGDDKLKQMLGQIAQKGPNLRNAGIRS